MWTVFLLTIENLWWKIAGKHGRRRREHGKEGRREGKQHIFRDGMGEKTPLHFACCRGDPKAIIEALESGCNVNAADDVSPLASRDNSRRRHARGAML
jgi:hypothetical protein